jgi:hypothetical protein
MSMTSADWINIAKCNQKRMIASKVYTYKDTRLHHIFLDHWKTTQAAIKLAQSASSRQEIF